MTSYQKCTRMLLLFFLIQRNLSVAKSRWMSVSPCCYKEFLVCFNCPRCLVLGTLSLLPVVPLVLTVNQISLLPSREPYFAPWPYTFTMTFHFERIFFLFFFLFFKVLTYTGDCEQSPKLDSVPFSVLFFWKFSLKNVSQWKLFGCQVTGWQLCGRCSTTLRSTNISPSWSVPLNAMKHSDRHKQATDEMKAE